jgi:hypothetical protein
VEFATTWERSFEQPSLLAIFEQSSSGDFRAADVGPNPTFWSCFLSREWKTFGGELELAIEIPQR